MILRYFCFCYLLLTNQRRCHWNNFSKMQREMKRPPCFSVSSDAGLMVKPLNLYRYCNILLFLFKVLISWKKCPSTIVDQQLLEFIHIGHADWNCWYSNPGIIWMAIDNIGLSCRFFFSIVAPVLWNKVPPKSEQLQSCYCLEEPWRLVLYPVFGVRVRAFTSFFSVCGPCTNLDLPFIFYWCYCDFFVPLLWNPQSYWELGSIKLK